MKLENGVFCFSFHEVFTEIIYEIGGSMHFRSESGGVIFFRFESVLDRGPNHPGHDVIHFPSEGGKTQDFKL